MRVARHLQSRPGVPLAIEETDLDRILKLIPTEVLSLYVATIPIATDVPSRFFRVVSFFIGIVAVPLVLALDSRATQRPARWPQYLGRTVVFAIWASAAAWPFALWFAPGGLRWALAMAVPLVPYAAAGNDSMHRRTR
jgi:hypothetical protein